MSGGYGSLLLCMAGRPQAGRTYTEVAEADEGGEPSLP